MWLQIGPSAESPGTDVNARNFRSRASNCALLTITVVCICVLVVCGVMIVREYSLGKGYSPATCNVTNVTYDTNAIKCMYCDTKGKQKEKQGCIFTYFPCVHVLVSYQKTEGGHHHKGMLHTDSLQAAGPYYMVSLLQEPNRPLGYERVYLPLCAVADTPFHIQADVYIYGFKQILQLINSV